MSPQYFWGGPGEYRSRKNIDRTDAVSRILVSSVAICASAMLFGASPVTHADPVAACGPDQPTAVNVVLAHEPHEVLTGRAFSGARIVMVDPLPPDQLKVWS